MSADRADAELFEGKSSQGYRIKAQVRDQVFRIHAQFGLTDSTCFRGRLNERRIRGRLRVTDRLPDGTRCASRWIVFNVTPR